MTIAAILCEYNPLHAGHRRHIELTKAEGFDAVVGVMSGNFVQRGDLAIYDKWARAKSAVDAGMNLVVEIPTACVLQSAQGYAESGVALMAALHAAVVSFGSECGDAALLDRAALTLSQRLDAVKAEMEKGLSYPVACKAALGELGFLLDTPNNTLGIEYCAAIRRQGLSITPFSVLRDPASERASLLRAKLYGGEGTHEMKYLDRAMLARLRTLSPEYYVTLPDVTEGLENRIWAAVREALTVDEVIDRVCTKRYTKARIRRILLRAFLDLPDVPTPSALRVLALDRVGRKVIKEAALPAVTKAARADLALEARCTDLYALGTKHPHPCGEEYTKEIYYRDH
ncbi:MAG TPA: nucleotidyltransferase family protein [Candidatus Acidoferrum sp.]|nr:nucleotidyltransferase family protein [Candidatus Acidoferrum sp.]